MTAIPPAAARPSHPVMMAMVCAGLVATLGGLSIPSATPPKATPTPDPAPEHAPPSVAKTDAAIRIDGRTVEEWRELMNTLDHEDASRTEYVPGLIEIVKSAQIPWFTRRQAALTLGRWGSAAADAVPILAALLDEQEDQEEETTVFWALKGLSLFGPEASEVVPRVSLLVLDSARPEAQRLAGMECLSQIGSAHPAAISPLLQIAQATKDSSTPLMVRRGAIEALGLFRGGAPAAVPVLIRVLDDPNVDLRREAATALGRQGGNAEIAQPALFDRFVGDEDPIVRDAAGTALSLTGTAALPALLSLLEEKDSELRVRSADVIGNWGSAAASAAPVLKPLWDDPVAEVRLAALVATWKVTRQGAAIAPRAARELTDANRNIRRSAYLLLESLGPAAASARPVLEEQLHHPRPEIRSVARKLLATQTQP